MKRCFTNFTCLILGHKYRPAANLLRHNVKGSLWLCRRCKDRKWRK